MKNYQFIAENLYNIKATEEIINMCAVNLTADFEEDCPLNYSKSTKDKLVFHNTFTNLIRDEISYSDYTTIVSISKNSFGIEIKGNDNESAYLFFMALYTDFLLAEKE